MVCLNSIHTYIHYVSSAYMEYQWTDSIRHHSHLLKIACEFTILGESLKMIYVVVTAA